MSRLDEWNAWLQTHQAMFAGGTIIHVDIDTQTAFKSTIASITIEHAVLTVQSNGTVRMARVSQRGEIASNWPTVFTGQPPFDYKISGGRPISAPTTLKDGGVLFIFHKTQVTLQPAHAAPVRV